MVIFFSHRDGEERRGTTVTFQKLSFQLFEQGLRGVYQVSGF
jgi:hypothetical protein